MVQSAVLECRMNYLTTENDSAAFGLKFFIILSDMLNTTSLPATPHMNFSTAVGCPTIIDSTYKRIATSRSCGDYFCKCEFGLVKLVPTTMILFEEAFMIEIDYST